MSQYAVVIKSEADVESTTKVVDDLGQALATAADARTSGAADVRIFEEVKGKVVFTANLVDTDEPKGSPVNIGRQNGASVHPIRRAAFIKRPHGAKRSSGDLSKLRTRILSWIVTNPKKGAEDISQALGVPTKDLVLPMRQLQSEGKIRKSGRARAVKYAAVVRIPLPKKTARKAA